MRTPQRGMLPICGIAAARKVFKPFKIEGRGRAEAGLPTLFFLVYKNKEMACHDERIS